MIAKFVALLFYLSGLSSLARIVLTRNKRFVLMFHGIIKERRDDLTTKAQSGLTVAELRRIIQWVGCRYDILSPSEFFETSKPGILFTFDDGKANNYHNALPVLRQHDIPSIFFITMQHVKDTRNWLPFTKECAATQWKKVEEVPEELAVDLFDGMSENQLREIGDEADIELGAHTISHPFLTKVTDDLLEFELSSGRDELEKMGNQKVRCFAYPSGDYNEHVMSAVKGTGYEWAFAIDSEYFGDPKLEIPRIGIYQANSPYLALKLSGLYRRALKPYVKA